jgi:DNA-directed RNA polymerase specialized sigma24 family protein
MIHKACHECLNYEHGTGKPACLKCKKYRFLFPRSQSVRLAPSPPTIIIDSIPNPERLVNIFDVIGTLEPREASIVMLHYLAGTTFREIGKLHGISYQMVDKILKLSTEKIRKRLERQ